MDNRSGGREFILRECSILHDHYRRVTSRRHEMLRNFMKHLGSRLTHQTALDGDIAFNLQGATLPARLNPGRRAPESTPVVRMQR